MSKRHVAILAIPALVALASCVGVLEPDNEHATEAARADEVAPPVLAVRVDLARGRRWELSWGAVSAYDVATNRPVRRITLDGANLSGARDISLPDMLLEGSGALVVSSNAQPYLWRVSPERFEVERYEIELDSDQGQDFGFSGLAWAAEGRTLYASSATTGTRWLIDLAASRASKLPTT